MKKTLLIIIATFAIQFGFCQENGHKTLENENQAIKNVIEKAYIEGILTTLDENTIRSGFHAAFQMFVNKNNGLEKVNLDEWLRRLSKMKNNNPEFWEAKTNYDSIQINIVGHAAAIQFDVYKGEKFFSTDFMQLYKFDNGWKIVSKIYTTDK